MYRSYDVHACGEYVGYVYRIGKGRWHAVSRDGVQIPFAFHLAWEAADALTKKAWLG